MMVKQKYFYLIIITLLLFLIVIMRQMSHTEDKVITSERSRLRNLIAQNTLAQLQFGDGSALIGMECNHVFGGNCKTDKITREIAGKEECQKRVPKAIIAGVQKGGTGTLIYFLSFHPEIVACTYQEIDYFDFHFDKPLSWYSDQMPCSYSHQITIEKSPSYFYRKYTAKRVNATVPDMKIILIMKEPIARAESHYAMNYKKYEANNFEEAVTKRDGDNTTVIDKNVNLIRFSDYATQVKPWLEYIQRDQILFVDGRNFIENPSEELEKVEIFLGIKSFFTPDRFWLNETKGMNCLVLSDSEKLCMPPSKGRTHPFYSSKVRSLLEDYFRPLNEQFFSLINRRFDWGY